MTDPFAAPAAVPSSFANIQSFHGRLCLWAPTAMEMKPNDAGQMKPRLTVDVTVVDGAGPVQKFAQKMPTGVYLDGPDFPGTYVSGQRLVLQLDAALQSRGMVLGRLGLYKEGQPQGQGNPWGLIDPTEEDKQIARNFLANRTISAASAPAAAPVQPNTYAQQATAYVPPTAPPLLPTPGSAPSGVNPFA